MASKAASGVPGAGTAAKVAIKAAQKAQEQRDRRKQNRQQNKNQGRNKQGPQSKTNGEGDSKATAIKVGGGIGAGLFGFLLLMMLAFSGGGLGGGGLDFGGIEPSTPGQELQEVIDERFELYARVAAENDLPWTVLAGSADILSDHGRYSPYDHIDRDPDRDDIVDDNGITGGLYQRSSNDTLTISVGGAPNDARAVTIIGDEVTRASDPAIRAGFRDAGWTVTDMVINDGWTLTQVSNYLSTNHGTLAPIVVIDVDAHGTTKEEIVRELNDVHTKVGLTRTVYFVDRYDTTNDTDTIFNEALGELAVYVSNVKALSWSVRAASQPNLTQPDGVTPTEEGAALRGQIISETVVGYQTSTGNQVTGRSGTSDAAEITGTGTSWETISPPIGTDLTHAHGPFLLDHLGIPEGVRPNISEYSEYETAVELYAELLLQAKDLVVAEGFAEPDATDLEGADQFWVEVLKKLPIVDPTSPALSCATSGTDPVAELIATIWRCEARAYPDLTVVTALGTGDNGQLQPETVTGAPAALQLLDDAYQVAFAWSQWGTDLNGPAAGTGCAPSDRYAGVFPLTVDAFNAAVADEDRARGADRCDPIANIRAAARIVLAGENVPVEERDGQGSWAITWGGWADIPHATGPDAVRDEFASNGPVSTTPTAECRAAITSYLTEIGTITDLEGFNPATPDNQLIISINNKIRALREHNPARRECADLSTDTFLNTVANMARTNAEEIGTDANAPVPDENDPSAFDDDTDPANTTVTPSADALRGFATWVDTFHLPVDAVCTSCALPQLRTLNTNSTTAAESVGTSALIRRFSPTALSWTTPAANVQIGGEDKEALARRIVAAAIFYGGIVEDDPRAGTRPDSDLLGGGDEVAGLVAAGVPEPAARAYVNAVRVHKELHPDSGMTVAYLAAFAWVESGHGTHGGAIMDSAGNISPPIIGVPLDGRGPVALVRDTDGGALDGDTVYDRAVGPFQFIPGTWNSFKVDANNDGIADPQNMHDAAATAAEYLYQSATPLNGEQQLRDAAYAYNRSPDYVEKVITKMYEYQTAINTARPLGEVDLTGAETVSSPIGDIQVMPVRGIVVNVTIASQVEAMLAHAERDGLVLSGGGFRSSESQIQTRKNNCGTSHYAIYEMPASQCSPPTARPGTSMHERGLAIDFSNCSTRSTACYQWLDRNAATYGFKNLPSEPWHWSTSGG